MGEKDFITRAKHINSTLITGLKEKNTGGGAGQEVLLLHCLGRLPATSYGRVCFSTAQQAQALADLPAPAASVRFPPTRRCPPSPAPFGALLRHSPELQQPLVICSCTPASSHQPVTPKDFSPVPTLTLETWHCQNILAMRVPLTCLLGTESSWG